MQFSFWRALSRRRTFDTPEHESELARVLTLFDLTTLCVGSTLGLGVYVLAAVVAYDVAGPAVIISFLIAGIASTLSAMCYAEFAARVPRAGSAYIYSYVTIGEFMALTIGWNLVLEYVIGTAGVARGLSSYIDTMAGGHMSKVLNSTMHMNPDHLADYPDFLSGGAVLIVTLLLAYDVKLSSFANIIFTSINLGTICIVVLVGSTHFQPAYWNIPASNIPKGFGNGGFCPFGISGIFLGAARCFFGFVGFDCVGTCGEEAVNPKLNIPRAIKISLVIIFLAYFGISTALTMMVPYYELDTNAPLIHIFEKIEYHVVKWIVTVGSFVALGTSLLGAMFPLPRILYAMAKDRLIFHCFSNVNRYTKTPLFATIFSGIFTAFLAIIFDLDQLIEMMSIGTLLAYAMVAICVMILAYEDIDKPMPTVPLTKGIFFKQCINWDHRNDEPTELSSAYVKFFVIIYAIVCIIWCSFAHICRLTFFLDISLSVIETSVLIALTIVLLVIMILIDRQQSAAPDLFFKVPFIPYIPCTSIFMNFFLMFQLQAMTWIRFTVWLAVGYVIYFGYGIWHSGQIERDSWKESKSQQNLGGNV